MTNPYLVPTLGDDEALQRESMRAGFGRGLRVAGDKESRVVALGADLTESTHMHLFRDAFPDRYIQVGIAEQNLVTVASGMASMGMIPFVASYAVFSPGRTWEQIRTTICLNDQPVKIIGSHAGISVGPDGATHQMLEDIALMRVLPNMIVIAPADSVEAEKATLAMVHNNKPSYIRLSRDATPVFTTALTPFEIGAAYVLREGVDTTLLGTGSMTYTCLVAAEMLARDGIHVEVIHVPTIKPLDTETIVQSVRKTGCVVTVEEAQIAGGFGGAVAELLTEQCPVPLRRIGMNDCFGESGSARELMEFFGLDEKHIVLAVHDSIDAKRRRAM